jgi:hypothetical protein
MEKQLSVLIPLGQAQGPEKILDATRLDRRRYESRNESCSRSQGNAGTGKKEAAGDGLKFGLSQFAHAKFLSEVAFWLTPTPRTDGEYGIPTHLRKNFLKRAFDN